MAEHIAYLKSCAINEQVYLACLLNNPQLFNTEETCYCLNALSSDIFKVAKQLYEKGNSFTVQTLTAEVLKVNETVTLDIISAIKNTIEYCIDDFSTLYKKNLIEAYIKNTVQSGILKRVSSNMLSKGKLDLDAISDTINELQWALDTVQEKNLKLKDFNVLLKRYEDELTDRGNHSSFMSAGNSFLDSHLVGGGIPKGQFITIFAGPGMGKSSYLRNLVSGNINKKAPLLYMPLEMGETLAMDGLISLKTRIPLKEFYEADPVTGSVPDYILEAFNQEKERLLRDKAFRLVDSASTSLRDVHTYIKDMKKELGLKSVQVAIDLFTMLIEGRGDNKASSYQDLCDGFLEVLKEENSTGIAIVQSNRKKDIHVTTYEDCLKYTPKIEEIKGSQAFEERSRAIISVFRQKHVGIRTLGEDDPEVMIADDIMTVSILKQNLGSLATLKYLYAGDTGKVWRLLDEESVD